jgi:hypothetical protein
VAWHPFHPVIWHHFHPVAIREFALDQVDGTSHLLLVRRDVRKICDRDTKSMTGYSLTFCGYICIRVGITYMHRACGAPHPCRLSQRRRSPSVGDAGPPVSGPGKPCPSRCHFRPNHLALRRLTIPPRSFVLKSRLTFSVDL